MREAVFAEMLAKIRAVLPTLDAFLKREGVDKAQVAEGPEQVSPNFGVYDKSTIKKVAKVVVTIVYNIEK